MIQDQNDQEPTQRMGKHLRRDTPPLFNRMYGLDDFYPSFVRLACVELICDICTGMRDLVPGTMSVRRFSHGDPECWSGLFSKIVKTKSREHGIADRTTGGVKRAQIIPA